MYNHAPPDYSCPICLAINGVESEKTMMLQNDIIYRDDLVMAVINSKFVGNNPGHVIVVPVMHYENLYELENKCAHRIIDVAKYVSKAIKEIRKCDGVQIVQNNEPASGQHAFHYHMHLFPRFNGDKLWDHMNEARVAPPEERDRYSEPLKTYLKNNPISDLT